LSRKPRRPALSTTPHIVTIYDIAECGGTDFIAMESVDGQTLDQLIHVHILEMNGESYRLKSSKQKRAAERLK
jgi:serine/threonine protein kinase